MNLNYSHLPKWLEGNWLFRRLFLLRKLYLTRATASHCSQFAEDVSIGRLFAHERAGFFVDVGCFHPKKFNNTWRLYQQGWRGINIDIDPIKVEGFRIARPGDTNIACAVSDVEGEVSYHSNGFYSLTVTVEPCFAAGKQGYVQKTTRSARLTRLIDESVYKDRQIDFLSVDAEQHDINVLLSLDFVRYQPRVVAVECHQAVFRDVCRSRVYQLLEAKGYGLVAWCGLTLVMASAAQQQAMGGQELRAA